MLKKYYLLLLLTITVTANAQTDSLAQDTLTKKEKPVKMKLSIRAAYVFPDGIGENVVAKANDGKYGINFKVNIVEIHRFNFGVGYEFLKYEVTDHAMAANIKNSHFSTFFVEAMYRIPVISKLTVYPKVSVGQTTFRQRKGNRDYGQQEGVHFGAGLNLDYEIAQNIELFVSGAYNLSAVHVETNREYEDYFGKLEQLNFALGLKINILN